MEIVDNTAKLVPINLQKKSSAQNYYKLNNQMQRILPDDYELVYIKDSNTVFVFYLSLSFYYDTRHLPLTSMFEARTGEPTGVRYFTPDFVLFCLPNLL